MKLVRGSWQDAVKKLKPALFDGILFDPFSYTNSPKNEELKFIKEAFRLLKKGGVLTYYENKKNGISRANELKKIGYSKISFRICKVNPPKYCKYYKNKTISAPILIK